MGSRIRVTYATLSADNEDLHTAYEEGLQIARSWFGTTHPGLGSGTAERTSGATFDVPARATSPSVLCRVHAATAADVDDAVARPPGLRPGRPRPGRSGSPCCAAPPT